MNDNNQTAKNADNDEIELRDIFKTLGKWKRTILCVTIGAMLLVGIVSFFFITPIYEARTVITAAQKKNMSAPKNSVYIIKEDQKFHSLNEDSVNLPITNISADDYAEILESAWILDKTIGELKLNTTSIKLKKMIEVKKLKNSTGLEIIVNYKDPVIVQKIANTLVEELHIYIKKMEEEQLDRVCCVLKKQQETAQDDLDEALINYTDFQIRQADTGSAALANYKVQSEETKLQNAINRKSDIVDLLNTKLLELNIASSFNQSADSIIVISPATEPDRPAKPNKMLNVVIAGVLALMFSVFGVFLLEYLREDQ